jgi:protein O-mannosyl-transferase
VRPDNRPLDAAGHGGPLDAFLARAARMSSSPSLTRDKNRRSLALGIVFALTLVVYAAGLRGDFMFDDIPNIATNNKVQIQSLDWPQLRQAWGSGVVGINGRALAMLSFGINHAISGLNPGAFKFVNLLLHLLSGVVLFGLTRMLTKVVDGKPSDGLALWVTAAWLLHPVNVTPVLMVVQRMTEISALFTFAGMLLYLHLRIAPPASKLAQWLAWSSVPLLWYLGFLGKETAVLAPLLALAIEFYVLRRSGVAATLPPRVAKALVGVIAAACVAAIVLAYLRWWVFAPASLVMRDFTQVERVMTEARVVWIYVKLIMFPVLSDFNLFHDGLEISRGWLSPWTTLAALLAWIAALGLLATYGRRSPLVGFGIAWFLIGHLLESTIIPLELMFEHRNYVPSFGLILAAGELFRRNITTAAANRRQAIAIVVGTVALAVLAMQTATRAYAFGAPLRLYTFEAENNPRSSRAQVALALALHEEYLERMPADRELRNRIQAHLTRATELDAEVTYPLLAKIHMACIYGDAIDSAWSDALLKRWQTRKVWGDPIRTINQFANAAIGGKICLDEATVRLHFDTFLANPHAAAPYRANVLIRYGEFMLVVAQDKDAALSHARQALALSQTSAVKQQYASLLHRLGEFDEARRVLRLVPLEQRTH